MICFNTILQHNVVSYSNTNVCTNTTNNNTTNNNNNNNTHNTNTTNNHHRISEGVRQKGYAC